MSVGAVGTYAGFSTYQPPMARLALSPSANEELGGAQAVAKAGAQNAVAAGGAAAASGAAGVEGVDGAMSAAEAQRAKVSEPCQTCENRQYQDGSDDPGVSFKSAAHIDPDVAASVVMAHEQEHVSHEQAKAKAEDKQVLFQSVVLHTSICTECGRTYVAGGLTTTVTKKENNPEEQKDQMLRMFGVGGSDPTASGNRLDQGA